MKSTQPADFASAAMVRALAQGMHMLGLRPPDVSVDTAHATVPLDLKRAVLQSAMEQGGLACLPLLGRGVHDLAMEPTHLALTAGRQAGSLFTRWQRLERYIHSRHRIRWDQTTEQGVRMTHVAVGGSSPPLPAESLVVCGILCALLEANGMISVIARAGDTELFPQPVHGALHKLAESGQTAHWSLAWQTTPDATHLPLAKPALSWRQVAPPLWSELAVSVGELVARQLPEQVRLEAVAVALGLSCRSLQRALALQGLSFTALHAEVRFRLAAWHLIQSPMPIAETGFVCGYSDQSHLTREFSRRVGVPPLRYREHFAVA